MDVRAPSSLTETVFPYPLPHTQPHSLMPRGCSCLLSPLRDCDIPSHILYLAPSERPRPLSPRRDRDIPSHIPYLAPLPIP
jgi:hypothetical protein